MALAMPVSLLITSPSDAEGGSTVSAVRTVHAAQPHLQIAIYLRWRQDTDVRALRPLLHAGARDVISWDLDDDSSSVRDVFVRSSGTDVQERLATRISSIRDPLVRAALATCCGPSAPALSVDAMSRALSVSVWKLETSFRQAGLPSPRVSISMFRLIKAAELLGDARRPLARVARLLNFGSSGNLTKMLRRYTSLTPAELRARGAARHMLDAFFAGRLTSSQQRRDS